MDSNEIAKHIDVLDRMAKARDPRSFVEMTIWHNRANERFCITAHYIEYKCKSNDPLEAVEMLYKALLDGTREKPTEEALAAMLGINDAPSWIDYPTRRAS
jgi:hypothetical protein